MEENRIKIDDWRMKFGDAYCVSMRNLTCYMGTLLQDLWEIDGPKEGERFWEIAEAGKIIKRLAENSLDMLTVLGKRGLYEEIQEDVEHWKGET